MPSNNIRCCLLIRDPLQDNGEPQFKCIRAIQEMPDKLQEKWVKAIIEKVGLNSAEQHEENVSLQSFVLNPNGTVQMKSDSLNSDTEIYSAHYQPLTEVIDALKTNEQMKDLLANRLALSGASDNFDKALTLKVLNQTKLTHEISGFQATFDALQYGCIKSAAELQRLSKSFFLDDPLERELTPSRPSLQTSTL